jgi:hypothetical protein
MAGLASGFSLFGLVILFVIARRPNWRADFQWAGGGLLGGDCSSAFL